ncbi:phosphotransferase [Phycicoccus sp. BSK3Z-2]|uniref:Phosphotransferase n=1 Tax=Phycicoccus avicenniae TaxID=2828860 RepID=A0A941HZZ8_9MICO|nr:phosphotransferase [Phycicoccus avicenniae]MBR7743375.1 phosphotransferase [Phycicoccus avicenniae]
MPTDARHDAALLTGGAASDLLEAVLATSGGRLVGHVLDAVHPRPGAGTSVGYRVSVDRPPAAPVEEYLVLSTAHPRGLDERAPGLVVLDDGRHRVLAWRFPDDPLLPGLATACDPARVGSVLPGARPVVAVDLLGYRPLRRAVVRVRTGEGERDVAYVKVLRTTPGAAGGAADVTARHGMLRGAGLPVPAVTASTPDGLVVLEAAEGEPLAQAVAADGAAGLGVPDLVALLDRLPPAVLDLPRRAPWSDRADEFAGALEGTAWGRRAARVAGAVGSGSRRADLGPLVPTHGDLHDGQVTVRPGPAGWVVAGLLDVDTVGPGHRVDDLACLLAHAVSLGAAGAATARRWRTEAARVVDADALDVRTAGVLLSLAAGALGATELGTAPAGQDVESLLAAAESLVAGAAQPSSR